MHVAVGQHRAAERARRLRDQIVAHARTVHLRDRPAMHREQVNLMPGKERQQIVKFVGRIEPDASLDSERNGHGVAQGAQDGVNSGGFTQQAAAGAFAIDHRRRTAQIEVHGGDGMLLQFARRADQGGHVVADHLRHHRPAGGILQDGIENPAFEPGIVMDAKVFRPINVGPAVGGDDPPKRQIGHVLHRSQGKERFRPAQLRRENLGRCHFRLLIVILILIAIQL